MSDIHILEGVGNKWRVVMHFAIPNVNNAVGVNYRTALVNSGLGGTTILPEGTGAGDISTGELAQVTAGEVYEYTAHLLIETGGSGASQVAMLTTEYNRLSSAVIATLQNKLKYYGYTQDVA